ncbi:hypothetical protein WMO40_12135 [Bacillaceae bacterium CLA-AA-H227]|uniref:Uncharacterized protein n=1 Tax=Robertmurraya yapensis (ex Hitch et al 2024) TaxID=3133160 RepID=A0ACC6SBX3_9BACI|nr:hypothetical protein [Bacillus yapensis]
MSTQSNGDKKKQNASNMTNQQGSGTQYHKEHTNPAMGYGDIDPNAEQQSNVTDNTEH